PGGRLMLSRILRGAPLGALALLVSGLAACGGVQIPPGTPTTVLSLDHLTCADCGERLAAGLRRRSGVYAATFDRRKAEVSVTASPPFDALTEATALSKGEDYTLALGAGRGGYIAWAKPPEGADVLTIAKEGRDLPDLAPHLVHGKVTVVDFS